MPTPIDTVDDVFHEWGLGPNPTKPQAEWDMAPAPMSEIRQRWYQCSWHLCLFFI